MNASTIYVYIAYSISIIKDNTVGDSCYLQTVNNISVIDLQNETKTDEFQAFLV